VRAGRAALRRPPGSVRAEARRDRAGRNLLLSTAHPPPDGLVGFRTTARNPVRAYVGGRRWHGALGAIPLRRHAQIVLELGAYIPPHPFFLFGPNL
jgi:hypothetical protein